MQHNNSETFGCVFENYNLKDLSYIKTGGACDLLFYPKNSLSLSEFIKNSNGDVVCVGNFSNVLVSDLGIRKSVVCLKDSLNKMAFYDNFVKVDSGVMISKFILECVKNNVSCIENLFSIPGTLGGAVYMNAGIPGFEISDVLEEIEGIDKTTGEFIAIKKENFNFTYRKSNLSENLIITSLKLSTNAKQSDILSANINEVKRKRLKTQPILEKTLGSTFKNPRGFKAWELIKMSGCEKMFEKDAIISPLHCNFLINAGNATSSNFFTLIQKIKEKVLRETEVLLEEEIIYLGDF